MTEITPIYLTCNVWEDTGVRPSCKFAWLSAGGQTQCPSGHANGLVECWSLLSGSPVEPRPSTQFFSQPWKKTAFHGCEKNCVVGLGSRLRLRLVRVEGNFHRGLARYGLGSVRVPPLILPQKTGALLDRRPSKGA